MGIFRHRPLFLCCSVFMLACLAGFFLPPWGKAALGGSLLFGAVFFCVSRGRRREFRRVAVCGAALLLTLSGLLGSHLWFHGKDAAALTAHEGETVTVTGVITDRRGSGGYMTAYGMELTAINGIAIDRRVLLTCHYVSDLQPGYTVALTARVVSLSEAAGDGYDATALMGDGYIAGLLSEDEEAVTVLSEEDGGLSVRVGALRRRLSARLEQAVGDGAKGLPSALLFGDRAYLADSVRRDFARAGVSHLLAVSGLHMTLLFGLFEGILRIFRVPKRVRAVILSVCAAGYLTVLGFPPSAVRAAVMLGVVYLSHLLSSRADALTSLGIAGAVILAVSPYAVADAGFWMSYLATLGLVSLMPSVNQWARGRAKDTFLPGRLAAGLCKALACLCVGAVAMSFTLLLVAAVMGEMGVLSPVSTILLTPLCGAVLVLSLLTLPLSGGAAGALLGGLTEVVCEVMAKLSARMGDPAWAVVSLRHPAVAPLAFCMLAGILVLLTVTLPRGRRWTVAMPFVVGWVALGGVLGIHILLTAGDMTVTYLQPSSQSDMLVLTEGHEAVICDLSNGSLTSMNTAVRESETQGATEIAALMLTHYHSRASGTLGETLNREKVRALWLPEPQSSEDYYHLLACLEKAEAAGVPVFLYGEGEALTLFGGCEVIAETDFIKRSVQPILLLSLDAGEGNRLIYCGSAVFESGLAEAAAELVAHADTVIFGNHGPLPKAPFGEGLTLKEDAELILSAEGDVAGWFIPACVDEQAMWLGQWRGVIRLRE